LLRTTYPREFPEIVVNSHHCERSGLAPSRLDLRRGLGEIWGHSETEGTLRKPPYALAHAHSLRFETKSEKNKNIQEKIVNLLGELYVETMKTKAAKKQKRQGRQKRNPFACAGWRSFILRSVRADQAARARVTTTGETLH
jgi:hypothetical protein